MLDAGRSNMRSPVQCVCVFVSVYVASGCVFVAVVIIVDVLALLAQSFLVVLQVCIVFVFYCVAWWSFPIAAAVAAIQLIVF